MLDEECGVPVKCCHNVKGEVLRQLSKLTLEAGAGRQTIPLCFNHFVNTLVGGIWDYLADCPLFPDEMDGGLRTAEKRLPQQGMPSLRVGTYLGLPDEQHVWCLPARAVFELLESVSKITSFGSIVPRKRPFDSQSYLQARGRPCSPARG